MGVNDTVHTVRLQFDLKIQSHSEKNAPCEWASSVQVVLLRFLYRNLMGYMGLSVIVALFE